MNIDKQKCKKLYWVWTAMKQRCYNPNTKQYKNYGKNGIKVCNEWKNSFEKFKNWAFENGYKITETRNTKYTIDRIDVYGDYCPNNCRITDLNNQANNKTNNHYIKIHDKTLTMSEISKKTGINYSTIRTRIYSDKKIEEILKPVNNTIKEHVDLNKYVTINGETKTIKEFSLIYGIKYTTIRRRVAHGYKNEELIQKPHSGKMLERMK